MPLDTNIHISEYINYKIVSLNRNIMSTAGGKIYVPLSSL